MFGSDFGSVAKYFTRNLRLPFKPPWSLSLVLHDDAHSLRCHRGHLTRRDRPWLAPSRAMQRRGHRPRGPLRGRGGLCLMHDTSKHHQPPLQTLTRKNVVRRILALCARPQGGSMEPCTASATRMLWRGARRWSDSARPTGPDTGATRSSICRPSSLCGGWM